MIPESRHSSWLRTFISRCVLLSVIVPSMGGSTGCERDAGTAGDARPEEVERALRLARGLASQGEFEQAIEELDRAIVARPDLVEIYGARARV